MIINGILIDMKSYDTKKGLVVNLYIQEGPPSRVIFHSASWKEEAGIVKEKLHIGDTVTMSGYATSIDKGKYVTIEDINIIEVKRSVVVTDQIVLLNEHSETDAAKKGDNHD